MECVFEGKSCVWGVCGVESGNVINVDDDEFFDGWRVEDCVSVVVYLGFVFVLAGPVDIGVCVFFLSCSACGVVAPCLMDRCFVVGTCPVFAGIADDFFV